MRTAQGLRPAYWITMSSSQTTGMSCYGSARTRNMVGCCVTRPTYETHDGVADLTAVIMTARLLLLIQFKRLAWTQKVVNKSYD